MIIPIKCFGCGKPTGHLWDKYVSLVKKYRDEDDDRPTSGDKNDLTRPTPEGRALDELGMIRECCRIIFSCNADISLEISSR